MAQETRIVYVCPNCFNLSAEPMECCNQMMIQCDAGVPGDERSRPLMTAEGKLATRAPKWWVERCMQMRKSQKRT